MNPLLTGDDDFLQRPLFIMLRDMFKKNISKIEATYAGCVLYFMNLKNYGVYQVYSDEFILNFMSIDACLVDSNFVGYDGKCSMIVLSASKIDIMMGHTVSRVCH
jgi:hypothetical protein